MLQEAKTDIGDLIALLDQAHQTLARYWLGDEFVIEVLLSSIIAKGHVLLAQFCDDTGIDLYPGDLTFWIKPADLEAKGFTKVLVTVGQEAINYNLDHFKPGER